MVWNYFLILQSARYLLHTFLLILDPDRKGPLFIFSRGKIVQAGEVICFYISFEKGTLKHGSACHFTLD